MKVLLGIGLVCSIAFSNSVPSSVWPQKDISEKSIGNPSSPKKVLIASRSSKFKEKIAQNIADSLSKDSVYIRVIGCNDLKEIDPIAWHAILIINTCMAWQYENKVQDFLRKNKDHSKMIVFTTSGDPKECGSEKDKFPKIDAITSASVDSKVQSLVNDLLVLIRKRLQ